MGNKLRHEGDEVRIKVIRGRDFRDLVRSSPAAAAPYRSL